MRKILLAVAATVFFASTGVEAAAAKLGFIDMQKALKTSDAGRSAQDQLTTRVKELEEAFKKLTAEGERMNADLENKKGSTALSKTALEDKTKDYQRKLTEIERFREDAKREIAEKDRNLMNGVIESLEKATNEFGKKNGYTFIFVRNETMLFVDEKADVTDHIIKLSNSSKKK